MYTVEPLFKIETDELGNKTGDLCIMLRLSGSVNNKEEFMSLLATAIKELNSTTAKALSVAKKEWESSKK